MSDVDSSSKSRHQLSPSSHAHRVFVAFGITGRCTSSRNDTKSNGTGQKCVDRTLRSRALT
eukprot:scaffold363943_cov18-Prasinocladus_malaysianus.AAC.1